MRLKHEALSFYIFIHENAHKLSASNLFELELKLIVNVCRARDKSVRGVKVDKCQFVDASLWQCNGEGPQKKNGVVIPIGRCQDVLHNPTLDVMVPEIPFLMNGDVVDGTAYGWTFTIADLDDDLLDDTGHLLAETNYIREFVVMLLVIIMLAVGVCLFMMRRPLHRWVAKRIGERCEVRVSVKRLVTRHSQCHDLELARKLNRMESIEKGESRSARQSSMDWQNIG